MVKVLVVDDETATRKGLMKHIPWSELGVHLVEEAKDGIDALEKANRFHPDIIITDIRMPGIDGIELAMKLKEQSPDCRIIFLSGYSDKEYLKAAINLGAVSYVEKPINLIEVKKAVGKAVDMHIETQKKKSAEKNITAVLSESLPFIKQKITMNLIHQKNDFKESLKELNLIDIPFSEKDRFCVMIIKQFIQIESADRENLSEIIAPLQIVDGCLSGIKHISAFDNSGCIVVILSPDMNGYRNMLISVFESMKEAVNKHNLRCVNLFCAVGQSVSGMDKISESYRTAVLALQKLFFYGYNKIVFYESNESEPVSIDENIHSVFSQYLEEGKKEQTVALVENLCRSINQNNSALVNQVKNIFFKLVFQLYREAEKRGVQFAESGENEERYLWALISNFQTLQEIREYTVDKINLLFEKIEELESSNRIIYKVMNHIKKQYSDMNLSTKILAELVYLTPTYLSSLFKKQTGKTIREYIMEVRIEKSKDYLKDAQLKLFEVARNVGYNDANYYAKVFKKLVGLTPSEYREKYIS